MEWNPSQIIEFLNRIQAKIESNKSTYVKWERDRRTEICTSKGRCNLSKFSENLDVNVLFELVYLF